MGQSKNRMLEAYEIEELEEKGLKISNAFVCIDCDEITSRGTYCPSCGSRVLVPLSKWLEPLSNNK